MRLFTLFLFLFISLAVPLQGVAGLLSGQVPPCPQASANTGPDDRKHDCCNDDETYAQTGKACKAEKSCQSGACALSRSAVTQPRLSLLRQPTPVAEPTLLAVYLAANWRPPNH